MTSLCLSTIFWTSNNMWPGLDYLYNKFWGIKASLKNDLRELGDNLQFITPLVVIAYCVLTPDLYLLKGFLACYGICLVIQLFLKALFNNPRPNEIGWNTRNPNLRLGWSPYKGNSFPSGHTMSAMCGGIFWTNMLTLPWFVGWIGISLGLITALSRLSARAHWMRDVFTSAIIAIVWWSIFDTNYLGNLGLKHLFGM